MLPILCHSCYVMWSIGSVIDHYFQFVHKVLPEAIIVHSSPMLNSWFKVQGCLLWWLNCAEDLNDNTGPKVSLMRTSTSEGCQQQAVITCFNRKFLRVQCFNFLSFEVWSLPICRLHAISGIIVLSHDSKAILHWCFASHSQPLRSPQWKESCLNLVQAFAPCAVVIEADVAHSQKLFEQNVRGKCVALRVSHIHQNQNHLLAKHGGCHKGDDGSHSIRHMRGGCKSFRFYFIKVDLMVVDAV